MQRNDTVVPTDADQQQILAAKLGATIDTAIATANAKRAHVQQRNATNVANNGAPRVFTVGAHVLLHNNDATLGTYLENKQIYSGPYEIVSLDDVRKRAQLKRLADGKILKTHVSQDRLAPFAGDVNQRIVNTNEPGALGWSGASDKGILNANELQSANKYIARAEAEAAKSAARTARVAAKAAKAAQRSDRDEAKIANLLTQADKDNARRRHAAKLRNAAIARQPLPAGAKAAKQQHHVSKGVQFWIPLDATDEAVGIWIDSTHERFDAIKRQYQKEHLRSWRRR